MASSLALMYKKGLISPPNWLPTNVIYEVQMGSRAYGCSAKDSSDYDIYAVCIPPKSYIFPHNSGLVYGFDKFPDFEVYQQHHIKNEDKEYDFTVYSLTHYLRLLFDNNPNIVDSLFVPENCIRHITPVGQLLRDNRKLFLSKRAWVKFRGYASAQKHKVYGKKSEVLSKIIKFENDYNIPSSTTISEVEEELKKRKII